MPTKGKDDSLRTQAREATARKQTMAKATGIHDGNRATGIQRFLTSMPKRDFADIEDLAEHVGDIAGFLSGATKHGNRTLSVTMTIPAAYQHEALDGMDASSFGFMMLRMYVVPRSAFGEAYQEPVEDDTDGG